LEKPFITQTSKPVTTKLSIKPIMRVATKNTPSWRLNASMIPMKIEARIKNEKTVLATPS
jgi:hypothetical protein